MNLYYIYPWIGCFNLLLILFLSTEMLPGRWLARVAKAKDGHPLGYLFKCWAVICILVGIVMLVYAWHSEELLKEFIIKPRYGRVILDYPLPMARFNLIFFIFTNFIPYLIGREVHSGKKIFSN